MGTRIPKISDAELQSRAARIKPVVRFARGMKGAFASHEGFLHYIKPVDLKNVSYIWDPKAAGEATGLKELGDITTYHTYGYYGFFKPSVAEVLAQIPEEYLTKAVAFEIIGSPQDADDLNDNLGALNEGYHVAKTRLYTAA